MSARDDILKKLARKTEIYKEYRQASVGKIRPEKLIAEFINAVEKIHSEDKIGVDFSSSVDSAYQRLLNRLRRWDTGVIVEILWDHEDNATIWQDLRPTGVRIVWSDRWKQENPTAEGEMHVSVEQLWLENL